MKTNYAQILVLLICWFFSPLVCAEVGVATVSLPEGLLLKQKEYDLAYKQYQEADKTLKAAKISLEHAKSHYIPTTKIFNKSEYRSVPKVIIWEERFWECAEYKTKKRNICTKVRMLNVLPE
ncbi:hypothetical protein [Shewanella sp. 4_MG-2023]|uniref:hypothetical protein n=1 Tax=Shewanella sp. 4_MG-2023 TaxID=3062652 RepID=UPI0026E1D477|nr:hypothetical protein [Shewanella sp. 4_MG-2023]MDO6679984.1 hypothetical protein [Shewanella sp. 4_MG-2023]